MTTSVLNRARPVSNGAYYTASVLYNAGFRGWPLVVMTAISGRESSWNPLAYNNNDTTMDNSVGLFQINYYGSLYQSRVSQFGAPQALLSDPQSQANAAYSLAGGNSLSGLGNWNMAASPGSGVTPLPLSDPNRYSIVPWLPQAAAAAAQVGQFGPASASSTAQASSWPGASGRPSVNAGGYGQNVLTSAPTGATSGCGSKTPIDLKVTSITWCQIKALTGGALMIAGGIGCVIGLSLIVVAGLGKSGGPIGQVAAGVVGYRTGRRTQRAQADKADAEANAAAERAGNPRRRGSASATAKADQAAAAQEPQF